MTEGKTKTKVKKDKRNLDSKKNQGKPGVASKVWGATKSSLAFANIGLMNLSGYLFKVGAAVLILSILIQISGLGVVAMLAILAGVMLVTGGIHYAPELLAKGKEIIGVKEEVAQAA